MQNLTKLCQKSQNPELMSVQYKDGSNDAKNLILSGQNAELDKYICKFLLNFNATFIDICRKEK